MLDGPDEDGDSPFSEKSPHEPEEFDPSNLGPDVPEPPDPPKGAQNSEVTTLFWKLVAVFNIAVLGLSVGPMFVFFEGETQLGVRITAVGGVLFAYGLARYLLFRRQQADTDQKG